MKIFVKFIEYIVFIWILFNVGSSHSGPINICTFTPMLIESFENLPIGSTDVESYSNGLIFSGFASVSTIDGKIIRGGNNWGLGNVLAQPAEGSRFFASDGQPATTTITFETPVDSFGGYFVYQTNTADMEFSFFDETNTLLDKLYLSYNPEPSGGNMRSAEFCSNGIPIKKVVIVAEYQAFDALSVRYTEITSNEITSAEITSSEMTTGFIIISECTFNPMITDDFESYGVNVKFNDKSILSGFGAISNSRNSAYIFQPLGSRIYFTNMNSVSTITFELPIHSFGGFFGMYSGAAEIRILFYSEDNTLLETIIYYYDPDVENNQMKHFQYCSSGTLIKYVVVQGSFITIDDIQVSYGGDFTSNSMTTGYSDISECTITPMVTDDFESYGTGITPFNCDPVLSGYAMLVNGQNEADIRSLPDSMGMNPHGDYMYVFGLGSFSSSLTFDPPVTSFGGYFGLLGGSGNIEFQFYSEFGPMMDTVVVAYDAAMTPGSLIPIQYCSSGPAIKSITIVGDRVAIDDLMITFQGDFTTNEITSSEMTTGMSIINSCVFNPTLTEGFESFEMGSNYRLPFPNTPILSGFAYLSSSNGQVIEGDWVWLLGAPGSGIYAFPADGTKFYGSDSDQLITYIAFETEVDAFGGYFGADAYSPDIELSFYASDGALIDTKYISYDVNSNAGHMQQVQYCTSGQKIKIVSVSGRYHVMDSLSFNIGGDFTTQSITSNELTSAEITSSEITSSEMTSSEITSSEITSSEVTTGNNDPIYPCGVAPTLTEDFESFNLGSNAKTPFENKRIFSDFASLSSTWGLLINGNNVWELVSEPKFYAQAADGQRFFASDDTSEYTMITFDNPVDSFGGYFAAEENSPFIRIQFLADDFSIIDIKDFLYSPSSVSGVMKHVQYCALGQKIKAVVILGYFHAMDSLTVSFAGDFTTQSDITSSELTSAEITSSEITSSEITSSEITSSEITSSEITSSEMTTGFSVISECTFTPMLTENFDSYSFMSYMNFWNDRILSNFATVTNPTQDSYIEKYTNAIPQSPPNILGMNQVTEFEFDSPIHSFGGYFGFQTFRGSIVFSFYASDNTLLGTKSINHTTGVMKQAQYCTSGQTIKRVTIAGSMTAADDISIAYTDITSSAISSSEITSSEITSSDITSSDITSSEITSSEITSSDITSSDITSGEVTTGLEVINSCTVTPTLTETFEGYYMELLREINYTGPIFSGFATISNPVGYIIKGNNQWELSPMGIKAQPADGLKFYASRDDSSQVTSITFESPVDSFGGFFAADVFSPDIAISFYAYDNSLIDTKYVSYSPDSTGGYMKQVQYCTSGQKIKSVTIFGFNHVMDRLAVTFTGDFTTNDVTSAEITSSESEITSSDITSSDITSSEITSSEITSSEVTTGLDDPIYPCTFTPTLTEGFEGLDIGDGILVPWTSDVIFSGFATIANRYGYLVNGGSVWSLEPGITVEPADGAQFYASDDNIELTVITFETPVDSFGGYFSADAYSPSMQISFYADDNTLIETEHFTFYYTPPVGRMYSVQYCSSGQKIKSVRVFGKYHAMDLLSVSFTGDFTTQQSEITSNELTSAEITSSEITSSEITSSQISSSEITSSKITSSEITSSDVTTGFDLKISECTFTPMITENFDSYSFMFSMPFWNNRMLSNSATITSGYDSYIETSGDAHSSPNVLGMNRVITIEFDTPIDSFGGYFGFFSGSGDIVFSFYASDNTLLGTKSITHTTGPMKQAQYCRSGPRIKKITMSGTIYTADDISIAYSTDLTSNDITSSIITSSEITSSEITSSEITSSEISSSEITSSIITSGEVTTGNTDPIYECTVAPTLTEGFESFSVVSGYKVPFENNAIFSGFATIANQYGLIIRGDDKWVLEPSYWTVPADGSQFYAVDDSFQQTVITFNSPVDSFGGYFTAISFANNMEISFYADDNTLIDTEYFTYLIPNGGYGVMQHVQYCASSQKIKSVKIFGSYQAIDLLSVTFTGEFTTQSEITSNGITSAEITSSQVSSSEITSSEISSSEITTSKVTSSEVTSGFNNPIYSCSITPTLTESFELVLANDTIFLGFATIVNNQGKIMRGNNVWLLEPSVYVEPKDGAQFYVSDGYNDDTTITFETPVDSFGGYFAAVSFSPNVRISFYAADNSLIDTKSFTYSQSSTGRLQQAQYCASSKKIKSVRIIGSFHAMDLLSVTFTGDFTTQGGITSNGLTSAEITSSQISSSEITSSIISSSEVTSSKITSGEVTTGYVDPIYSCNVAATLTESFENYNMGSDSKLSLNNSAIFSGFATIMNPYGNLIRGNNIWAVEPGIYTRPYDGSQFYASDHATELTVITFEKLVDSFGLYFVADVYSPNMRISFYAADNSLIETEYFTYQYSPPFAPMRKVQYCAAGQKIKSISIFGKKHAIDLLTVTFTGTFTTQSEITSNTLTSAEITSSQISSSEISSSQISSSEISTSEITSSNVNNGAMTTGNSDPIYECNVIPTLTEGFESFYVDNGYQKYVSVATILSGFATVTNQFGVIIRGNAVWVLEPSVYTQPAEGSQFYASDRSNERTTITFNSPVDSFGGYFTINAYSSTIQITFYADDDTVIDTETFTYSNGGTGMMKHVQYCASGQKIKYVQIYGPNHAIDLVSVSFTGDFTTQSEITSNELTSAEITSSQISSSEITTSEISSAEISSNSITSNSISTNEITSNSISTNDVTSNSITTNSQTSNSITSSQISTNQITSSEISTSKLTTAWITSAQITSSEITSNQITSNHLTTSDMTTSVITTSQNINVVMTTGGSKLVSLVTVTFSSSGLFTLNQNNFTATMLLLAGINYNQNDIDRFVYTTNRAADGTVTVSFFIEEPRNVNDISSEELTQLIVEKLTEKLDSGEPINGMTLTSVNSDRVLLGEEEEKTENKKNNVGLKVAIGILVPVTVIGVISYIFVKRYYHQIKMKKQSQNIEMQNL